MRTPSISTLSRSESKPSHDQSHQPVAINNPPPIPTLVKDSASNSSIWTLLNRNLYRLILKRSIDVVASTLLLLLFSPVIGAAWVAVRLTSQGPGFFRQGRMGRNGITFQIFKLRSMYIDQDNRIDIAKIRQAEVQGKTFKSEMDPRVTPVGRFLRKTSIDELPQLWNVIRGEMSLVGPRPVSPTLLISHIEFAVQRSEVLPGITGLWQVSARSLNNSVDFMADYDLKYIENQTLTQDLSILLRTPMVVLSMDGAQ